MKMLSLFAFVLAFTIGFSASASAQTPPSVAVRYNSTFTDIQPPARYFNLLHGVSEFRPGEAARNNYTAGHRFFTALEGELTVLIGDKTQKFATGEKWDVPPGIYFGVKNEGSVTARIFFSALSPIGSQGPQPVPGSEIPSMSSRILHQVQTSVTVSTNRITVVQVVQDWPVGARNSNHAMNQPHLFSMMEGENTSFYFQGAPDRILANQAGIMHEDHGGYMQNTGSIPNRLFFTWVATPGEPNTVPVTPPAMDHASAGSPAAAPMITAPNTGDGGLLDRGFNAEALAVIGLGLLAFSSLALIFRPYAEVRGRRRER